MGGLGYIVCGWYTPGYAHWAARLGASLDALGEPHDIVARDDLAGGWERNTLRKPYEILNAMSRHPRKTIVFLDVDCEARGSLADLASIEADIAMHMRCRYSAGGLPMLRARSGTLVLRPTALARAFVGNWYEASAEATCGSVDQRTLPLAIARTPGLTVGVLDVKYCATGSDKVIEPVILHDNASKGARKVPGFVRSICFALGRRTAATDLTGGP